MKRVTITRHYTKRLFSLTAVILITAILFLGCQPNTTTSSTKAEDLATTTAPETTTKVVREPITINIGTLKGPTGMGMIQLIDQSTKGIYKDAYDFTIAGSPDELVGKIINGDVQVAAVPTNLAAALYNRTKGQLQLAAVNTLGVIYIIENGATVTSLNDLKGKTLHISGKGATPDFVIQYLLKEMELEGDVALEYSLEHADLANAMVSGDVAIGLLPQPFVTTALMKNPKLRVAIDLTQTWEDISDNTLTLPMGAIIVNREFAQNNPEAIEEFLMHYKASVDFVNSEVDEAAELIAKYEILPNAEIAKRAIPLSNIVYFSANDAIDFLEPFYEVLFNLEPKSIGGTLPDESFYYKGN